GQIVLVDHARGHGQMLPFALWIGEAEVVPVDLLVLDSRKDRARVGRHCANFPCSPRAKAGAMSHARSSRAWEVQIPRPPRRVRGSVRISLIRSEEHTSELQSQS